MSDIRYENTDILVRLQHTKCALEIFPITRNSTGIPCRHILFFSLQFPANHSEINSIKHLFVDAVKTVRISNTRIILVGENDICEYDEDNTTFNIIAISNDSETYSKVEEQVITFNFFDEPKVYSSAFHASSSAFSSSRVPLRSMT